MVVNRRLLLLGATLIVAIVTVMVVRSGNEPAPVAPRARPAGSDRAAVPSNTPPPADVNLAALTRDRGEPVEQARNPFRFRPKPAPPPPAPIAMPRPATPGDSAGTFSNVPTGPPPLPPIALKFIGVVQRADGMRIAVLTDGKRPIFGQEGQDIEGRYRIVKIGNESIELSYLDGRGRQTIPLKGQ